MQDFATSKRYQLDTFSRHSSVKSPPLCRSLSTQLLQACVRIHAQVTKCLIPGQQSRDWQHMVSHETEFWRTLNASLQPPAFMNMQNPHVSSSSSSSPGVAASPSRASEAADGSTTESPEGRKRVNCYKDAETKKWGAQYNFELKDKTAEVSVSGCKLQIAYHQHASVIPCSPVPQMWLPRSWRLL